MGAFFPRKKKLVHRFVSEQMCEHRLRETRVSEVELLIGKRNSVAAGGVC